MELRGTKKILNDSINTPIRKWGFSSMELGLSLLIGGVLTFIIWFLLGAIGIVIILLPIGFVFYRLSKFLKENQQKGIDNPINVLMSYGSVPKKISQQQDYKEIYFENGSKRSN